MGSTKYDWTDKTKSGLSKEEYDALWAEVNAIPAAYDIDDLGDVVITGVADHELLAWDAGTSKWINMTPAEAGLSAIFLALDASNDPITDTLEIAHATAATLVLNDTGGTQIDIASAADRLYFKADSVTKWRYRVTENALEIPLAASAPSGLLTPAVVFYEDTANEMLWAQWKDSTPVTHHAMVARAKRSVMDMTAGSAALSGATKVVIGANTDVGAVRFTEAGGNQSAVWSFARPVDWDYGKIRITVYWTNYNANVTGNHYWPQRLIGCAAGEHLAATQTCNGIIAGAQTTAGLNNSSLVGTTVIDAGAASTLTGEEVFFYRIQRQPGHGSDSSSADWEVIHVKAELITT